MSGDGGGGVVVVGAVNVDLVVVAPRLPAPGETVAGGGLQTFGGGKGANAAVAAARAGADVTLIAAVGADANGAGALDELRAEGIDCSGVAVLADQPTGVALIVVDGRGENQIALGPGANGALTVDHVTASLAPLLVAGAGCVVVSTEIPGPVVVAAVRAAVAADVLCVLNPAPVIPEVLDALRPDTGPGPVLTPNATELAQLTALLGGPSDRVVDVEEVRAQLVALARRTGAPAVVTLGADGCMLAWPDGVTGGIAVRPVEVVDTTGAGDTFTGVLAARLAAGIDMRRATAAAAAAASLSVTAAGARTGMPTAAAHPELFI